MRAWVFALVALLPVAVAGNASDSGVRAPTASVVATANGYDGVVPVSYISASAALGYSNQDAFTITNQGTVTTTFTAAEQADASGVVSSVTDCATSTTVGSTCIVKLTGPAKSAGTYSATITVQGSGGTTFESYLPSISVTIKYCLLPPC